MNKLGKLELLIPITDLEFKWYNYDGTQKPSYPPERNWLFEVHSKSELFNYEDVTEVELPKLDYRNNTVIPMVKIVIEKVYEDKEAQFFVESRKWKH